MKRWPPILPSRSGCSSHLLSLTKDDGEDPNEDNPKDTSYHAKDVDSDEEDDDDGLKYLGMEPWAKRMAKSIDVTCQHQWGLDSSWVKDAHKGLLKVLRIRPEGLTAQ